METRTPCDPGYVAVIGTAVYIFAYYEWVVICLIGQFNQGFVEHYSRGKPMTSGQVQKALDAVLADPHTSYTRVTKSELVSCSDRFKNLTLRRNGLIHAHPITDDDGSQVLNYQGEIKNPLPDLKWSVAEVDALIKDFDDAACATNDLLQRML